MGFEPMTSVIKKVQACSGFEPYWPKLFFRPCFPYFSSSAHDCEDRFHIHVFIRNSNIWLSYIHSRLFTTSRIYLQPTQWPAPGWHVRSACRALHRYRRGHGFKSRTGLNIFFRPSTAQVVFIIAKIAFILTCCILLSVCVQKQTTVNFHVNSKLWRYRTQKEI